MTSNSQQARTSRHRAPRQFSGCAKRLAVHAVLFVAMTMPLTVDNARAQSRQCLRLETQLASLISGMGNGSQAKRYDRAIQSQIAQIKRMNRSLESRDCGGSSSFFSRISRTCRKLKSTRRKMKRNLSKLERKRQRLGGGGDRDTNRQKRRIVRAMRRNGCAQSANFRSSNRSVMKQIFGKSSKGRNSEDMTRKLRNYNTFRTLCVRTCDGYYFPVSFSTTKRQFGRDAESCANTCPGSQLYFHSTSGQDSEDMISADTGEAYTALPTAFAYRKAFNTKCSCKGRKRPVFETNAGFSKSALRQSVAPLSNQQNPIRRVSKPVKRLDPNADPETLANLRGRTSAEEMAAFAIGGANEAEEANTKVRIVGDAYFPVR